MIVKLETELSKLNDIKKNIKEMGASLWQEALLKELEELDLKCRKRTLAGYKKSWGSY